MVELAPDLCRALSRRGRVVLDAADARHEAGDLLQAGLDLDAMETLGSVIARGDPVDGNGDRAPKPVLFKNCGWAGWDLAAARLASAPTTEPT